MQTASSRAMELAQLMSLPSAFHPGMRVHTDHLLPWMMPMPQLVEALTHNSGLRIRHGLREWAQWGLSRMASHQHRLSRIDLGAWQVAKSLGNLEMKEENGGKVEWPSL